VRDIDHRLDLVRSSILKWREQLGWKPGTHTPTGYYVFLGVDLLAYADEAPTTGEREAAFAQATLQPGAILRRFEHVAKDLAEERVPGVLVAAVEASEAKKKSDAEEKA
jgi:hypothetical protein